MKNFNKIYNNELLIMFITFVVSVILLAISASNKEMPPPIVSTMMWASILGMAIMRVIKAGVDELKDKIK